MSLLVGGLERVWNVTGPRARSRMIDGRVAQDAWRFTRIYVRRGAAWRVVALHASS